jgi:F-type H+-transporting ATPase subunit b
MSTTRRIGGAFAAILALTLGGLLLIAGPAGAAGESEGECFIEAVEEAEASGLEGDELYEVVEEDVLACTQAPSPILPEINEIIWGAFGFIIVFGVLAWKGMPAIKTTMNERSEKIRGDLEAAEAQRVEAEKVLAGYNAQLADAKTESARIIEEARQTADSVRAERIAAIDGEIAEMRQRAAADVEASKAQAMADLRGEVTALAIGAAERVVERNLDDATNRALVDAYIDQVGASS